jgi:uncharacterized membrane protein YdjX (TVP38/TMEM64 family)
MRRLAVLYALVLGAMLALFALVEAIEAPLLSDPQPLQGRSQLAAALTGVTLLVVDVVLPVPSSVVMIAHGGLFGIVPGAALSTAGALGAFAVAFALGRRGAAVLTKVVDDDERRRADRLFSRWGLVAIILSRPVPMLAETVAFAAGGSSLPWRTALIAAALASVPMTVVYAVAGAAAATFTSGAVVFVAVAMVALAAALVVRSNRVVAQGSRS